MKKLCILTIFLLCWACNMIGAGTLGGFKGWILPVSEKEMKLAFEKIYQEYPQYTIPTKWKKLDDWESRGFGFLNGTVLYLQSNSIEEMYFVSFHEGDEFSTYNHKTMISVRSVNKGDLRWLNVEDYNNNLDEVKRIESTFFTEIVTKLEKILNVKASEEK
jgi:hypothetical protein